MQNKSEKYSLIIIFIILIYFPVFLHLDLPSLYLWDESTNALHALDMEESGNYLRRFFQGQPDNWETKPPLLTWLQVFWIKILGPTELAIRMPSALSVLGTLFLILRFFWKEFRNLEVGIFSGLILVCSSGYVCEHVSRTGDHDALLIFFLLGGLIYFYKFLKYKEKQIFYITLFTLFFIGGVLTKSIAGLYFAPGLLIFTLLKKQFFPTIKNTYFWIAVGSFFGIIGAYYGLNEWYYPGYLEAVWNMELFPRFFNTNDEFHNVPDPFYFIRKIITEKFVFFFPALIVGLAFVYLQKKNPFKDFIYLLIIIISIFLIAISNGAFNTWYDAPAYPILATIAGMGVFYIYDFIKTKLSFKRGIYNSLYTIFFISIIFYFPYKTILTEQCYFPKWQNHYPHYGDYLKKLKSEKPKVKNIFIIEKRVNRHLMFYEKVFNKNYNYNIKHYIISKKDRTRISDLKIPANHTLMICDNKIKNNISNHFYLEILEQFRTCTLYKISNKK